MPNIYRYLSCNEFLYDVYKEKNGINSKFTYRYFGNKLHLDPGFLFRVFQGKSKLAATSIPHICKFLKLDKNQSDYFEFLVYYSRSKTAKDINMYFEKLMALRNLDAFQISSHHYDYYKKWHHTAIRCLLSFKKFTDFENLGSSLNPPISSQEAKNSILLLEKLGLIEKDQAGGYKLIEKILTTGDKWQSEAIESYHSEMIRLAGEALFRHKKEERDISSVTICIDKGRLVELQARVKEMRHSILKMHQEQSNINSVYQVNIQIFPLTK